MINPKQRIYPRSLSEEPPAGGSHALILDYVGSGKRVLEFGCSTGYMSRFFVKRGCQVTGIEWDPLAAAEARGVCEEVVVADLDTRPLLDILPGKPFDVAVFGDVLEHLRDPWRVLDETRSFLGPGSFVVISLPNVAHGAVRLSLLRGSFNYEDQGLLDATHLRFFTFRSVRELCMRAGYRIEEVRRTKLDIFLKSDLLPEVHEKDFDPELIEEIRRDPDSDTVQFVVKATPLSDRDKFVVAISDLMESDRKLDRAADAVLKRDLEIAVLRQRIDELEHVSKAAVADREAAAAMFSEHLAEIESALRMTEARHETEQGQLLSTRSLLENAIREVRSEEPIAGGPSVAWLPDLASVTEAPLPDALASVLKWHASA